jgi:hypothetical protein
MPTLAPVGHLLSGHRVRHGVALRQLAADLQQQAALCHGLHPFSGDLPVKGVGQADDPIQDGQIVRVVEHVVHKAPVDLELIHGQPLQVGQGRVAGAKVIETNLAPKCLRIWESATQTCKIPQMGQ